MPRRISRLAPWMILAMMTLLFAAPLSAQRITGQLRGKISDPSLAGLGGVTVELTSTNVIGTRTTVTTNRGDYRFITLPPGFYDLTFRHPDFKTEELRHVRVAVGTTTRKDMTLRLATLADTVDVTAEMSRVAGLAPSDERLARLNASKRAQGQEEAPISIAAFDAPAFENRRMYDLSDLADFTPNLEFATTASTGGTNNHATVFIRGLGQVDTSPWFDPGVGIYLDGVYLARARGAVLGLVDVEVVEVLRGPQGTLFGKNTLGGAISIVTRKPGSDLTGHVELRVGNFDRSDGSARVSGGLSPGLFASLSAASTNTGGFTRSLATGEDYNDDNTDSARLALRWQASKSVTVDWTADASRERERGADPVATGIQRATGITFTFYNNALTLAGRQPYDERWVTGSLRESHATTSPSFADSDTSGTSLDVYALLRTHLSLRSITSYRASEFSEMKDVDGSPIDLIVESFDADQRQWSEEVWLSGLSTNGRLTWVLGGLYFAQRSQEQSRTAVFIDLFETLEALPGPLVSPRGEPPSLCYPGPPPPGVGCYGGRGNPLNRSALVYIQPGTINREPVARSYALFGEATFDLGDRLSLTAGLRYSHEKKELFSRFSRGIVTDRFLEISWNSPTARFNLAFQATATAMLYVTASSGFKSGGISDHYHFRVRPFAPARVWLYEAGFKADLFANRLRLQGALFWNDYTDLQLTIWEPPFGSLVLGSAGEAEVKGFDLSLQARFSDDFHIDAGVGHVDAVYTHLEEMADDFTIGDEFPRTPEWNFVVSPEVVFRFGEGGAVVLHADYTYKTRMFFDVANSTSQEAYGLANARASLLLPSGAWEAYAYATNLADREYKEHGFFYEGFGLSSAVAGRPREWGVGLKHRF